jgi:hypothetical protein
MHDLRGTYASLLVEQGAHPKEMAELMRHSCVQITLDHYSHVMPRLTSALADRMDHAYRDAAAGDRSVDEGDPSSTSVSRRPIGHGRRLRHVAVSSLRKGRFRTPFAPHASSHPIRTRRRRRKPRAG